MAENTSPDVSTFCASQDPITSVPAIHFIGGQILEPQIDPTKGTPGPCSLTLDLTGKLQSAMAPLAPFMTLLDLVATLAQFVLLLAEVVTNPLKIIELLKLIPGLVGKINQVLALVPIFPQGIVQMVTFIVDTLRFIGQQIGCIVAMLESVQQELRNLGELVEKINGADDELTRVNLQKLYDCSAETAQQNAGIAMAALGPIARILCTVRALLSLIPGGKEIAKKLQFPDPSHIEKLDDAITALRAVKTIILETVEFIEAIAIPFGGIFPPPELAFKCPLDSELDSTDPIVPDVALDLVLDAMRVPITTIATVAPDAPPTKLIIQGSGLVERTQVYWSTAPLKGIAILSDGELSVEVGAELLQSKGKFYLCLVNSNEPQGAVEPGTPPALPSFGGIASEPGAEVDTGVKTSEQYTIEVV